MESNDTMTNRSPEDIMIGLIIFIPCLIWLLMYIPVAWIFARNPNFSQKSCYQIMLSLAISDCINLIGWLIIGSNIFLHGNFYNETFFTAVLVGNFGGWRNLSWHQAIMAYNRYVATCAHMKYSTMFAPRRTAILICVAWIHSIVWGSLAFIPPKITLILDGYYTDFPNRIMNKFYLIEDTICSAFCLIFCGVCYTKVIMRYREARRRVTEAHRHTEGQNQARAKQDKTSVKQYRLALQMFLGSIFYASNAIGFYMVSGVAMNECLAFFIATYTGVMNNGVSVIIYLMFNRELRLEVRRRFFPWEIRCTKVEHPHMMNSDCAYPRTGQPSKARLMKRTGGSRMAASEM